MRPKSLLRHYLQGLLMGTADVVPGVSGGTVALVVGVYQRLLEAAGTVTDAVFRVARADVAGTREAAKRIDFALLLPLGAGIITALLTGASIIPGLMEDYPAQTRALFFGLIAGSILIPWGRIRSRSALHVAVMVVAAGGAFLFAGMPDRTVSEPSLFTVFGAASLAICAMILPGVSGAFLLLVMGMYERTLDALHDREVAYIAVFAAGAAFGFMAFSWVLRRLLERAHDVTMAALIGLMAGSLRALWPFVEADRSLRGPVEGDPVVAAIALALAGLLFVVALMRLGGAAGEAEPAKE
jgi:putative membrane protein